MAIACAVKQRENLLSGDERASQRMFFGICALLFVASAAVTIHCCTGMSMPELPMPGGWSLSTMWLRMCGQTWLEAAISFVAMWLAMMVAMMLPSLTPALWRYYRALVWIRRFDQTQRPNSAFPLTERCRNAPAVLALRESRISVAFAIPSVLIAGLAYFFVWTVIGIAVFAIGIAVMTLAIRLPKLASVVPLVGGLMILMAGALQFTSWKTERLACCREVLRCHGLPASVDIARIRTRWIAAWRYGVRLGYHCSACCAGLTVILLVIGVMDLRAMAPITVAVNVERFAGTVSTARFIGVVVVAIGTFMMARAAAMI